MKDPKTYFYHLAMDVHRGLSDEHLYLDSVVEAEDIAEYRGMCQLNLLDWPEPVLVLYARGSEFFDTDPGEAPPTELTQLRAGLVDCGLEELACYRMPNLVEELDPEEDEEAPCYCLGYDYSLVTQLAQTDERGACHVTRFQKATRKAARLFWGLAG